MPNYKAHLFGGFVCFALLLAIPIYVFHYTFSMDSSLLVWLLICSLAGALFPDIDTKSKGQFYFSTIAFFFIVIAIMLKKWMWLSGISLALITPLLVNHRGITHQIWFIFTAPFCIPLIAAYTSKALIFPAFMGYIFFVCGALSHLILDFGPFRFLQRGLFGWPKRRR